MEKTSIVLSRQRYRWVVFAALAVSYLLAFSQRTAPGLITDRLQTEFAVSAAVLGTMASVQYLLYMILQVPVGFFSDRFGPEKLLTIGVFLDGFGTLIFSQAHNFAWLLVGRAFVGSGDALIWVNLVLIVGKWFAPAEFGGMLGLAGTFGNIGALIATIPFAAWISAAGWRIPFLVLGVLLMLVSWADMGLLSGMWLPGRRKAKDMPQQLRIHKISLSATLRVVIRDRLAWATFLTHFGALGSYLGFTSLWAIPFYMNVYGLSRSGAAQIILVGFVGAIIGGPLTGYLSDRFDERKRPYVVLQTAAGLAWMLIPLYGGHPPLWVAYVSLFILGVVCGGSLLTFAVIRDVTPKDRSGVTSGFANSGGFLSAVLLPIAFGAVIDYVGRGQLTGPTIDKAYEFAFLVPILFSVFGVIGSLMYPSEAKRKAEQKQRFEEDGI